MSDRWVLSIDGVDPEIEVSMGRKSIRLFLREHVCKVVILRGKSGDIQLFFNSSSAGVRFVGKLSTQNELLSSGIPDNGTVSRSGNERHWRRHGEWWRPGNLRRFWLLRRSGWWRRRFR